jgi:hypothetical protein
LFKIVDLYHQKTLSHAEYEKKQHNTEILGNLLGIEIGDEKTIIVYFNSECHFCENEIIEIGNNIKYFENYQLILLSFEPKSTAIKFLSEYNLSNFYTKVNSDSLTNTITGGVPQTFIYKNGLLQKHFKGEVKFEAILEVLK